MTQQRTLGILVLGLALILTGCYRDSGESLEIMNTGGAQSAPTFTPFVSEATPTLPLLIETTPTTDAGVLPTATLSEPTATVQLLQPATVSSGQTGSTATPTLVILELPLTTPTALPPTLLPTATQIQVITPVVGNPPQVNIASPTPASVGTTPNAPSTNGLLPTPTDLFETTPSVAGECIYVVQNGDNLFRIAVNNNVDLAELLAANGLNDQSIIQPGQEITIPNCTPDETAVATATPASVEAQPTALPANTTIHRVASGDTLSTIARRYGVSLQAIVDANNLTNPDRLQIGQELVIPNQ